MIDILIAYVKGTRPIATVCLESLRRHDAGEPYRVTILTDRAGEYEAGILSAKYGVAMRAFDMPTIHEASWRHAWLLDRGIRESESDLVLTLDSDCFPVADGWLAGLKGMVDNGALVAGILWPWKPPSDELSVCTIEWKIRRCHNWGNTQVACQLIKRSFVVDNDLTFGGGEDTGFRILDKVRDAGGRIEGYMPTCCALPDFGLDPEVNRHVCVIYGDKVYHHGGASRQSQGAVIDVRDYYARVRDRVVTDMGAEWIMQPGNHHRYRFDKEDEVVRVKMEAMYAAIQEYLKTHDAIF